ncbi:MAG: U32 family peptidase [Muribaculaceae bacterium]|nr:U32 family peptidase [Muribaculaceae bacterium]
MSSRKLGKLELLSPAANADTAIQAILHGADAVYIGPPSHGARKSAANSIEDIERVVDFAHQYRARVYATVNTIVYDNEIKGVESLCRDLYHAGVDALIVQDMGILRMNIPPIALHASTQCDIRTPEKALFLQEVGFSQLVLARELTLREIREIAEAVSIPIETFIHGALCVSYSGRCQASYALTGRSANRGECCQVCRFPFTLKDSAGNVLARDKYLLSLKDFNATPQLEQLIEAGVSSFKIEGRLKETGYVKNITAHYNKELNRIVRENSGKYERSSMGEVELKFTPQPEKSFNRGFSNYFLGSRRPANLASLLTPKSLGEEIKRPEELNNGDGISFFDKKGQYQGVNVNRVDNGRIIPARPVEIPKKGKIYRTSDIKWEGVMKGTTATRKIGVAISLDARGVTIRAGKQLMARVELGLKGEKALRPMDYRSLFEKLGNTPYVLKEFSSAIDSSVFYRASEMTALRRHLIETLERGAKASYPYDYRRKENPEAGYPYSHLDYRDNVANRLAREFYLSHGVESLEPAAETSGKMSPGQTLMTTRHCILRELGLCYKEMCHKEKGNPRKLDFPLYLEYEGGRFLLDFDCSRCEMNVKKS